MGFLRGILRKATEVVAQWSFNDPTWYARNGYASMYELLGGGSATSAGISINVPLAMQCGAAYVCTRAITESMATMPLQLKQRKGDVTRKATDSPLYNVLATRPNSYQTAKTFRRTLQHHALNYGAGRAKLIRRGNDPDEPVIAWHIMHPRDVEKTNPTGQEPIYKWNKPGGFQEFLKGSDVFEILNHSDDGFTGKGAVELGREAIALSLTIEKFGSAFFARGGVPAGMIVKPVPFKTQEDRDKFEKDHQNKYEGSHNFFKKWVLEGAGWEYKPFGLSNTESQMSETAAAMIPAICRPYGLTPHLAGDLSRAHFANVEHLWIEFLQITLMPWMVAWEQEIERVMLSKRERENGYYAKHNANAFQRGDFETRMKGYATLLQNGVTSINECRELEDLDPVEGGDAHHIQLNMQTVPGSGDPTTSERATILKISDGKPKASA